MAMKASRRLRSRLIRIDRMVAWVLILVAALAVFSGYGTTKGLWHPSLMLDIHLWSAWFFIALLAFHISVTTALKPFRWSRLSRNIWSRSGSSSYWLRLLQRLSSLVVLVGALLVIISGLDWYDIGFGDALPFSQHLEYDIYLAVGAIVHVAISLKLALARRPLAARGMRAALVNVSIVALALFAFLSIVYVDSGRTSGVSAFPGDYTAPTAVTEVQIGHDEFALGLTQVEPIRPDLFNPGSVSRLVAG